MPYKNNAFGLMRVCAAVLLGAVMAACGGGGGGSSPSPSESTPELKVRVQGLAVGAELAVSDGLETSRIVNDNGVLVLSRPASGAPYSVSVTSQPDNQVCEVKSGNGTLTAAVTVSVDCADGIALSDDQASPFRIGRIVGVDVRVPLTGVAATLGDKPLIVEEAQSQLFFLVPEQPEGRYTLQVKASGRTFTIPIDIEEPFLPEPPRQYVQSALADVQQYIDAAMPDVSQETAALLAALKTRLDEEWHVLAGQDDATVLQQARIIFANGLLDGYRGQSDSSPMARALFNLAACEQDARDYPLAFIATITSGAGTIAAALTQQWVAALIGAGLFYISFDHSQEVVSDIMLHCFAPFNPLQLLAPDVEGFGTRSIARSVARSDAGMLSFNHGKARLFSPQQRMRVDAMIKSDLVTQIQRVGDIFTTLSSWADKLGGQLPDRWMAVLREYTPERDELIAPGALQLGAISDGRITGMLGVEEEALRLVFRFKESGQMPEEPIRFSFTLTQAGSGASAPATFSAVLNPADRPKAFDGEFSVDRTQPYAGVLSGEFADRFELRDRPLYGSITLNDPETGAFTYRPDLLLTAKMDQFTFVAVNDFGESEPAMVSVTLQDGSCRLTWPETGDTEVLIYSCHIETDLGYRVTEETFISHHVQSFDGRREAFRYTEKEYERADDDYERVTQETEVEYVRYLGDPGAWESQVRHAQIAYLDELPRRDGFALSYLQLASDGRVYVSSGQYKSISVGMRDFIPGLDTWGNHTMWNCSDPVVGLIGSKRTQRTRYVLDSSGVIRQEQEDDVSYQQLEGEQCLVWSDIRPLMPLRARAKLEDRENWIVYQRYLSGE